MLWVLVIGLAAWVLAQQRWLARLEGEVKRLTLAANTSEREPESAFTPRSAPGERTVIIAEVAEAIASAPPVADALGAYLRGINEDRPPRPATARLAEPRPLWPSAMSIEAWLSQNGLAWIGGVALVIGAAFLVGFAAEQGLFTPPVRIASAGLLGVLMLAAGEAMRRRTQGRLGEHPLAAAIVSGAGAAVLYGAVWAAYALYGFIGGGACAILLIAIVGGLLALSFLHGEALGLLALSGAFVVPLIASRGDWSLLALTAYLAILIGAGLTVAMLRAWTRAGWAVLAGAGLWSILAVLEQSGLKSLLLACEPLAVLAIAARVRPHPTIRVWGDGALVLASSLGAVALLSVYAASGSPHNAAILVGALGGLGLPLMAAFLVRGGWVRAPIQAGPALTVGISGAATALLQLVHGQGLPALWLGQAVVLVLTGLWASWRMPKRTAASGPAALGALVLGAASGWCFWPGAMAAAPLLAVCFLLTACLWRFRQAPGADRDTANLETWSAAAAAALLAAIGLGAPWGIQSAAFAASGALLALLHRRFGWISLAAASVTAAALAMATLMDPKLLSFATSGVSGATTILALGLLAGVAALFNARLVTGVGRQPGLAQSLLALSPLSLLIAAFVALRWAVSAGAGLPLDSVPESSVQTLLIGAAGLVALMRLPGDASRLARWRTHGFLMAAALHAVVLQVMFENPWWGWSPHPVAGVPLLNALAVSYLAPCLLFAAASWRSYFSDRRLGRTYGALGALLGVLWATLELRRWTHGSALSGDPASIGASEACAYAVALLLAPPGLAFLRRRFGAALPAGLSDDLAALDAPLRWVNAGLAVLLTAVWSNPWWGPAARAFSSPIEALAVFGGYAAVAGLIVILARDARRAGQIRLAAFGDAAAVLMGVITASLLVRWSFHGDNLMPSNQPASWETWTYSAVWAVIGLALLVLPRAWGRNFSRLGLGLLLLATVKVFLFDTAHLAGAVRAGSFLVVGVLLVIGALTARRTASSAVKVEDTPHGA